MAVDFYLKLNGITGESQAQGHVGEIQLLSFNFGGTNASSVTAGTGSGAGKVSLGAINVTKTTDSASLALFLNMCKGTHISTGTLAAVKAGGGNGQPYFTMQLTEIYIVSWQLGAQTETPVETVGLSFRSIQLTYFAQNPDGTLVAKGVAGWDVSKNASL